MRLSISGRVVKSYDVEVSAPRMVESLEGFQQLGPRLTVLSVEEEDRTSANSEHLSWIANPIEVEAKEKAAAIFAEAQEKAAIILAEAEAEAQEIRVQAQADADRFRQEVVETARAEVYPAAQSEGYQAGLQKGEAEGNRLFQEANQLFNLAQRAVQEEYAKVDGELLGLAIKIAERIVRSSLAVEPQRLAAIIQALTLLPQNREGWRLHVAPEDARWLERVGNQPPCPWVSDESLGPGDCFLECQEGIFDAQLEAQLVKLEQSLREEFEHGGLESFDAESGTN
ncbi:FliH/SctL family protein [Desulfosporosinus sp. Sb-LF]|uniref:FliH/SctL family protein n=1 Tax=Desulfosporosinus sp. Sb-LF TaxID=2560027 RepID=UPI00107F91DC|nr:FliH/SctL family protein [Desulfosporosinus sp. Sb-LF]TGE32614.1 flagellar assembly protein FliH [Desulfosporosinus sp. Sb-LF]